MGMIAALALAAFAGTPAISADTKTNVKKSCVCCGDTCTCVVCTCDAKAKAGLACDCCGGAACCSTKASVIKTVKLEKVEKACCSKPTAETKAAVVTVASVKKSCDCCGDTCTCAVCTCDAKAKTVAKSVSR